MPETATLPSSADLSQQALAAAARFNDLRTRPADKRGENHDAEIRTARSEVLNLDALVQVAERAERRTVEQLAWDDAIAAAARGEVRGPSAAFAPLGQTETRSAGEAFVDRDEYRSWQSDGAYSRFPAQELRGSLFHETRALLDSGTSEGDAGLLRPVGQPTMPPQTIRRQRLFVRDLLTVIPTGLGGGVPYVQELNPLTNETGATAVAEGTAKPEVTMEFKQVTAPIVKIAAWIPVTEEILMDAPTLSGYINSRLAYMLALREEVQILNGPGTGPNMTGIRQTVGLQTQAVVASDFPAVIGLAISKIENVDGDADGVAVNPLNFWVAQVTRHANQFDNGFGGSAPAQPSGVTWGLPTVRTRGMESGKALVGAYRLGATLLDRMRTTIRTSDSHDDWFVYNKIAVLAEERVGLAVHRPDWFCEATVPTS